MPYIGKKPENIIATAIDSTTGDFSGVVTANAGIKVDNITIDGSEIDFSSGSFTVDVNENIIFDSDTGIIKLADGGTNFGQLDKSGNNLRIISSISDGDIVFRGDDGGSGIDALTLDMSAAGFATFNDGITLKGESFLNTGSTTIMTMKDDGSSNFILRSFQQDKDVIFQGNDGGSVITALTLDMSEGGRAIFTDDVLLTTDNKSVKVGAGNDLSLTSDGTNGTIAAPNGDLTLDVAGDIILDADGGDVNFQDGGTLYGFMAKSSDNLLIGNAISDGDVLIRGNDGGSNITAMTIDMSEGGRVGIGMTPDTSVKVSINGGIGTTNGAASGPTHTFYSDADTGMFRAGANILGFATGASERMRIDSSGNLLVGKTSASTATVGAEFRANGVGIFGRSSDYPLILNRTTDQGGILLFRQDGTNEGAISIHNDILKIFATKSTSNCGLGFFSNNTIRPLGNNGAEADNEVDMGHSSTRFDDIRATNGTIQTSDRNDKQDIEELTDAEKRVAVVAKGLMRKFRWKDKVASKGDNARTHFGIIAQDLQDAFTAESLDASKYAMFCSDTWWEKEITVDAVKAVDEVKDEEGNVTTEAVEAKDAYTYMDTKEVATTGYTEKTRLGVRYSELLAFIISAM